MKSDTWTCRRPRGAFLCTRIPALERAAQARRISKESLVLRLEPRQPHAHRVHSRREAPKTVDQRLRPPTKLQRFDQRPHAELGHLVPSPMVLHQTLELRPRPVVL